MTKQTYSIPSIHCQHCAHTIKMELSELEGVEKVSVNVEVKSIDVDFDLPATERGIEDLLSEINYPVEK